MKLKVLILSLLLGLVFISLNACDDRFDDDDDDDENEYEVSYHGDDESHRAGENCMDCHHQNGADGIWFKVAGTIFSESSNASSKFQASSINIKDANNDVITRLEVDDNGNFFTTKDIDFSDGLYTELIFLNDTIRMNSSINSGQCNSCHGEGQMELSI